MANYGPESSGSSCDHSFIVLNRETADEDGMADPETGNPGSSMNANGSMTGPLTFSTLHFPAATATPTVSNGEAHSCGSHESKSSYVNDQQKIEALVHHNQVLQDTVNQSNRTMEGIMNAMSDWKEEKKLLWQEHKQKFQETRDLVLKLKKENAELRDVIEGLEHQAEELRSRAMPSIFDTLAPDVAAIELNATIADLQSQLNIAEAARQAEQERNVAYEGELISLKKDISLMKPQLEQLDALKSDIENYKTSLEDLGNLRDENMRLKNEILNLSSVERHCLNYQVAQAEGFTHKVDELTVKLMSAEESLQKAQAEISELKSQLIISGSNEVEALGTVDHLRSRIDDMTAIIVDLEQKCEHQTQEINTLQAESIILRRENEAVGILQAQADVYRADFVAERDCRTRIAMEKEALAEDLRRLHRHNRELGGHLSSNATTPREEENRNEEQPETIGVEEQPPSSIYRCPICQTITFRTLQMLNEHIDHCLEPV